MDARLAAAQTHMAVAEWEGAEQKLSEASCMWGGRCAALCCTAGSQAVAVMGSAVVDSTCRQGAASPCISLTRPLCRCLTVLQALAAAEALSGASGPRIALVLLLTAHSYSRTGRVTLAEGLYREAAKMLQLRPEAAGACGGGRMMVGV